MMLEAWRGLKIVLVEIALIPAFPAHAQEPLPVSDSLVLASITDEAFQRSAVMEVLERLTDRFGGRLPVSPQYREAMDSAAETLNRWGAGRIWKEEWPYGPGWFNERTYAHVIAPVSFPLSAYPLAWTPGTDGWVRGEVLKIDRTDPNELERFRGRLKGKFVLTEPPARLDTTYRSQIRLYRLTDAELRELELGQPYWESWPEPPSGIDYTEVMSAGFRQYLLEEEVAAWIGTDSGLGRSVRVNCCDPRAPSLPTMITLVPDDYGRLYRLVGGGEPVELEVNIQNEFDHDHTMAANLMAEMRGSSMPDEVVMLGAHFDSWHGATGAQDNGAGVAIVMEALRILSAVHAPLKRTVRLALWGMEERPYPDGAMTHVFRNYVRWAGRASRSEPILDRKRIGHDQISVYFNPDHGAGRIRGIYSNGNDAALPLLREWLQRLVGLDAETVSPYVIHSSDHDIFNYVGIPGFMFIQDPGFSKGSSMHHGNGDAFDSVIEADLQQAAAVVAGMVYLAANDDRTVPRMSTTLAEPDPRIEEAISRIDLAALAGQYGDDTAAIHVQEVNGILVMDWPGSLSRWELFPYAPFAFSTGRGLVDFVLDGDSVTGLFLTRNSGSREFLRRRSGADHQR